MPEQRLLLLGFGNVGQWLARLLLRHSAALAREHGIAFRITGIATGRHGVVCNPAGIDAHAALQLAAAGAQLGQALPRARRWNMSTDSILAVRAVRGPRVPYLRARKWLDAVEICGY